MSVLTEYKEKMRELEQLKNHVIRTLKTAVNACKPIDGVKPIGNSKLCFTVNLSTLQREGTWSPEYYSNEAQIEQVTKFLFREPDSGMLTVEGIANRMGKCIEQKYIKIVGRKFPLNSSMLKLLSELREELT